MVEYVVDCCLTLPMAFSSCIPLFFLRLLWKFAERCPSLLGPGYSRRHRSRSCQSNKSCAHQQHTLKVQVWVQVRRFPCQIQANRPQTDLLKSPHTHNTSHTTRHAATTRVTHNTYSTTHNTPHVVTRTEPQRSERVLVANSLIEHLP